MKKVYFSIRSVVAESRSEAIKNVEEGLFNDEYSICDKVLTKKELLEELKKEIK